MTRIQIAVVAGLALTASTFLTTAAAATLGVGDKAPKLQTGKWVQGDPVKEFAKGKAYIVEFWATWCGPCRVSIPHLNEIHQKYKDKGLVVIGQDCWERDESLVKPFIEKMGDKMTYRVALDDKSEDDKGAMAKTWMEAAGQNGIPSAFLVNKQGVIAWIGHPMSLKEKVIEEVLADTYDIKKAAEESKKAKESEGKLMKLSQQFSKQLQGKQWDEAEATLKEIGEALPEDQRDGLDSARIQILFGKEDLEGAAKLSEKVSDKNKDNAMAQNQLAWTLLTKEGIKGTALDIACKIAARANDAAEGKDAAILDTLARAHFMKGEKDKAIEMQEKAIKLADDESLKSQLKETLDSYKEGKLPKAE
jgi:thiol-disulfide isomerase/thioredoxin